MPNEQQQPTQVVITDVRASILEAVLGPFKRMLQNEVVFVLMLILVAGGACVYWAAVKLETFATEQIPKHIDAINSGARTVANDFSTKLKDRDEAFAADLKSQREHYQELRKLDESNIDRIERLATGKKTTAANNAVTPE